LIAGWHRSFLLLIVCAVMAFCSANSNERNSERRRPGLAQSKFRIVPLFGTCPLPRQLSVFRVGKAGWLGFSAASPRVHFPDFEKRILSPGFTRGYDRSLPPGGGDLRVLVVPPANRTLSVLRGWQNGVAWVLTGLRRVDFIFEKRLELAGLKPSPFPPVGYVRLRFVRSHVPILRCAPELHMGHPSSVGGLAAPAPERPKFQMP
jgi:hypothetical protein